MLLQPNNRRLKEMIAVSMVTRRGIIVERRPFLGTIGGNKDEDRWQSLMSCLNQTSFIFKWHVINTMQGSSPRGGSGTLMTTSDRAVNGHPPNTGGCIFSSGVVWACSTCSFSGNYKSSQKMNKYIICLIGQSKNGIGWPKNLVIQC